MELKKVKKIGHKILLGQLMKPLEVCRPYGLVYKQLTNYISLHSEFTTLNFHTQLKKPIVYRLIHDYQ